MEGKTLTELLKATAESVTTESVIDGKPEISQRGGEKDEMEKRNA